MKVSELVGKPVVSMADGEKVGVVEDMLIDPQNMDATAYLLGGPPGQGLLGFDQVKSVGPDAITIESAKVIKWVTGQLSTSTGREAHDLMKLKVVDAAGNATGTLQEIELDMKKGRVISFQVGGGGVFGIGGHSVKVPAASVRAIGTELITTEVAGRA